jgi:hypothetical protein
LKGGKCGDKAFAFVFAPGAVVAGIGFGYRERAGGWHIGDCDRRDDANARRLDLKVIRESCSKENGNEA